MTSAEERPPTGTEPDPAVASTARASATRRGAARAVAPPPDPSGQAGADTYRGRMWRVAARREVPLATILTTVLVTFLVLDVNLLAIWLLVVLRFVVLYIVMGLFLALLLTPAVRLVERGPIRHGLAAVIVFVACVLAVGGVVAAFTAPLVSAITHFAKEVPALVRQAEAGHGRIGHLLKHFHLESWVKRNVPKIASDITKSLKPAQAFSVGATALSTLVALAAVAVLTLFLLLEGPNLRRTLLARMSPPTAARVAKVYRQVSSSVTGYMLGDFLTSIVAGAVVAVSLSLLGVPYPLLLGLWVGLVDFLPLVGGLLAGVPVVLIAAFHSFGAALVMLVVFLAYQEIENHVLYPLVMSKTVRLSPLWVLVAVLVGATLGDKIGSGLGAFVGALIAIPVGGALQVIARELRRGPTAEAPPEILEALVEPEVLAERETER
ncbi:MAG: AI-2E family transporter [Actinomycetota bacterium]|jgi:predicted PurR-regulated permease PerM|nr:AI-2E family transporter [Actinomycetota bacterium]